MQQSVNRALELSLDRLVKIDFGGGLGARARHLPATLLATLGSISSPNGEKYEECDF